MGSRYWNRPRPDGCIVGGKKFPDVGATARSTAGYPSGSSPMDEGGILLPLRVILEVNDGIFGPREHSGVNDSPSIALGSMAGTDSSVGKLANKRARRRYII